MNRLREEIPIARFSRTMRISRSSIYYSKSLNTGRRKPRISGKIRSEILRIAGERTTYGYRRIWAPMRNHGTGVNVKTVRWIMRESALAPPHARHGNMNGRRYLTKPDAPDSLCEANIHYIPTRKDGMAYLISIKDCF